MKNSIKLTVLIILISASFLTGCKKDDKGASSSSTNTYTSAILTSGSWHVSYYHESGSDHTGNFNGYTFTFNANGTMAAVHSSGTINGTWSNDDSKNEFHMTIGNSSPLSDLSNGWTIISQSSSEVDMKDDNSSHNEELHFTKI